MFFHSEHNFLSKRKSFMFFHSEHHFFLHIFFKISCFFTASITFFYIFSSKFHVFSRKKRKKTAEQTRNKHLSRVFCPFSAPASMSSWREKEKATNTYRSARAWCPPMSWVTMSSKTGGPRIWFFRADISTLLVVFLRNATDQSGLINSDQVVFSMIF